MIVKDFIPNNLFIFRVLALLVISKNGKRMNSKLVVFQKIFLRKLKNLTVPIQRLVSKQLF